MRMKKRALEDMLSWVTIEAERAKVGAVALSQESIESMRNWCEKCAHLPRMKDNEYALFLYTCMASEKLAMHMVHNYFTQRAWLPQYFQRRDPYSDELQKIFKAVAIVPLEMRTGLTRRVIFITLIDSEPELFDLAAFVKYLNMVLDICIYEEGITAGFVFLVDLHRMTMRHVEGLREPALKALAEYFNRGFPADWTATHIVNSDRMKNEAVHAFVEALVEELRFSCKFTILHNTWRGVASHIPLDVLPCEIGPPDPARTAQSHRGRLLDLHNAQVKKLESHAYTFSAMDQRFETVRDNILLQL